MRINITARHFKLTDELKQYAEQEVYRLKKYYEPIIDCDIILGWQKKLRIAEINIAVYGTTLTAQEETVDMKKSIDKAVDKLERQIKKYKGRLRGFDHDTIDKHAGAEEAESAADTEETWMDS
jgi:putative sigma-54 modulation protein